MIKDVTSILSIDRSARAALLAWQSTPLPPADSPPSCRSPTPSKGDSDSPPASFSGPPRSVIGSTVAGSAGLHFAVGEVAGEPGMPWQGIPFPVRGV